ncbi:MAG: methylenetetrahydrofolate reductase C-terminal domain-containing protein [Deltaproteobacteria bacterium]|jgi:ferredoxin|nr:methylenetetrahydrofolate reductase C-terminal domain-containing protein [Deltaproteobacteria bacterium]
MIIAERKPISEIESFIQDASKVLILGCRGCVTVCNAGGTKEVEVLASLLRLSAQKEGRKVTIDERTLERQCDPEYVEEINGILSGYDVILSMACSIGPQFLTRRYPHQRFYPALNTSFLGGAMAHGIWSEHCQACGDCIIHKFGGMCPISRCAKSLLNGPCGGSADGFCEISRDVECVWQHIAKWMMENYDTAPSGSNEADNASNFPPIKDWSRNRDGGPRKIVREDLTK